MLCKLRLENIAGRDLDAVNHTREAKNEVGGYNDVHIVRKARLDR
jgi:hypothetical protein